MAYDSATDRFVWFGGWNGSLPLNQTWVFDPTSHVWTPLDPPHAPIARADSAFVYDSVNGLFYLFGGWAEYPNGTIYRLNDTWTYSLALDRWTEVSTTPSPSPRSDVAIAFDPRADAIVLFGGFSGTTYLGDTWSFSPGAGRWTSVAPLSLAPSARADGRMTYDNLTDQFVLFGGNNYSGPNLTFHHLNDTWSFRYGPSTWSPVAGSRSPVARDYAVQAFDPATGWVLLFGGYGNRTILNDLWAYNPSNESWWPLTSPAPPPPRFAGTGGFAVANSTLVIVGGLGTNGLLNDTWFFVVGAASSTPFSFIGVVAFGIGVLGVSMAVSLWVIRSQRPPR